MCIIQQTAKSLNSQADVKLLLKWQCLEMAFKTIVIITLHYLKEN